MKIFICVSTICLMFFIVSVSLVQSQTQAVEGYTLISGPTGPQVCLGRWVQPTDVALPGICEGQVLDLVQLTAISARQSVDRLDQLLLALASIDQRLAANNDKVDQLVEATVSTQASIGQQVRQVSELLSESISKRFDKLPEQILANDLFKEELTKLREDILKEVERHYSTRPTPATK